MISPLYFVAVIVLICLSGFFSASEMSFSSTNKLRLENMVEDEVKGAALALKVAERFDDALSAILIGNNRHGCQFCECRSAHACSGYWSDHGRKYRYHSDCLAGFMAWIQGRHFNSRNSVDGTWIHPVNIKEKPAKEYL